MILYTLFIQNPSSTFGSRLIFTDTIIVYFIYLTLFQTTLRTPNTLILNKSNNIHCTSFLHCYLSFDSFIFVFFVFCFLSLFHFFFQILQILLLRRTLDEKKNNQNIWFWLVIGTTPTIFHFICGYSIVSLNKTNTQILQWQNKDGMLYALARWQISHFNSWLCVSWFLPLCELSTYIHIFHFIFFFLLWSIVLKLVVYSVITRDQNEYTLLSLNDGSSSCQLCLFVDAISMLPHLFKKKPKNADMNFF